MSDLYDSDPSEWLGDPPDHDIADDISPQARRNLKSYAGKPNPNTALREILEAELDWAVKTGKTIRLHKLEQDINALIQDNRADEGAAIRLGLDDFMSVKLPIEQYLEQYNKQHLFGLPELSNEELAYGLTQLINALKLEGII